MRDLPRSDRQGLPGKNCESCHKDVHNGRFSKVGECASCHFATSWGPELKFDHNKQTRFGLTGKHEVVDCRACHRGKGPADYENFDKLISVGATKGKGKDKTTDIKVDCLGCHRHKEVHKRQFTSEQCLKCHNKPGEVKQANDAKSMGERVKIGHGPGKPFQLVDGHKNVECRKCHKNDNYRDTRTLCAACHEDRLHKGSLGKDSCNNCHEGGKWTALKFDHDKTNYPLEGRHKDAKCESCHPARRFKPTRRRARTRSAT